MTSPPYGIVLIGVSYKLVLGPDRVSAGRITHFHADLIHSLETGFSFVSCEVDAVCDCGYRQT